MGKSGHIENLLIDEEGLKKKGATFYKINRGGDITYHGPGQIVGYPILDLDNFFTDIHKYLRFLEEVIIHTLADYGLAAQASAPAAGRPGCRQRAAFSAFWSQIGSQGKVQAQAVRLDRIRWHGQIQPELAKRRVPVQANTHAAVDRKSVV